jgi:hypothetical protein
MRSFQGQWTGCLANISPVQMSADVVRKREEMLQVEEKSRGLVVLRCRVGNTITGLVTQQAMSPTCSLVPAIVYLHQPQLRIEVAVAFQMVTPRSVPSTATKLNKFNSFSFLIHMLAVLLYGHSSAGPAFWCNVLRRLRWQLTRLVAVCLQPCRSHAATAADNSTLAAAEKAEG